MFILLQPLRWRCVECAIHYEPEVEPDRECRKRLCQDSAFFFRTWTGVTFSISAEARVCAATS